MNLIISLIDIFLTNTVDACRMIVEESQRFKNGEFDVESKKMPKKVQKKAELYRAKIVVKHNNS